MTGVWENGPYLSTFQFSESDVKVCELEKSKSRRVNPEIVLLAAFDLHFFLHIHCLNWVPIWKTSVKGTH